jgi:hypothetical protein
LEDDGSIEDLFGSIISNLIERSLEDNLHAYDVGHDLDSISSSTFIDELIVTSLTVVKAINRINFYGTLDLHVTLPAHEEDGIKDRYPAEFDGYIDTSGIHLESASADISSFYK